jgi:ribosomal-protein-alanine N-acetyltransferase
LRKLTRQDIPDAMKTAVECRLCQWSAGAYEAELLRPDSIMLKLTTPEGRLAGFAVGRVVESGGGKYVAELLNIGIKKAFRHQGFGLRLLKSFIGECRTRGVGAVLLEVRRSNSTAIRFYRLSGFEKLAVRPEFYTDPVEDAITMRLVLAEGQKRPNIGLDIPT